MLALGLGKKTIMSVEDLLKYSKYEGEGWVKDSPVGKEMKIGQINNEDVWKQGRKTQLEGSNI
jgi:hypothetical protein